MNYLEKKKEGYITVKKVIVNGITTIKETTKTFESTHNKKGLNKALLGMEHRGLEPEKASFRKTGSVK